MGKDRIASVMPAAEPGQTVTDKPDGSDAMASPPASQPPAPETEVPDSAQPFTEGKFVPMSAVAKPAPADEQPAAPMPVPVAAGDAPVDDTQKPTDTQPDHLPEAPDTPKIGQKRKADVASTGTNNGTSGTNGTNGAASHSPNKTPAAAEVTPLSPSEDEPAGKKAKTNGGTAAPTNRRASKSVSSSVGVSEKRKKEPAPVGQTHRKTRSQGPVEAATQ